ncbi:hypothetical protein [Parafrankia elaeagni]|uniref:hypothetical protein n=1 Tax=Parafrankia elaeagni TaxID=222534 RepID=UPI00035E0FBD|nr:hypothetical protein [Parafrankia elaeagni]
MRILFSGEVSVHYSQLTVESQRDSLIPDLSTAFHGHQNGLCGSAVAGALFLITGLHTGRVGFTVELHDGPPPIDGSWEEIVEVSYEPASADVLLLQWAGEAWWPLDLDQTTYRVRYSGAGMDAAKAADTRLSDTPQLDRYRLQFWPGPAAPDRVIRQTSAIAAYWHAARPG